MLDLKSATEVTRLTILTVDVVNVRFCSVESWFAVCLTNRRDATMVLWVGLFVGAFIYTTWCGLSNWR